MEVSTDPVVERAGGAAPQPARESGATHGGDVGSTRRDWSYESAQQKHN